MSQGGAIQPATFLFRDGFGKGPIVAAQDSFGKLYRHLYRPAKPGEIIHGRNIPDTSADGVIPIGEDGLNTANFRILFPANPSEVRQLVRRAGLKNPLLDGLWYECISD